MKNKGTKWRLLGGVLLLVSLFALNRSHLQKKPASSVFSWFASELLHPDRTFKQLDEWDIQTIYQFIPYQANDDEVIHHFLQTAEHYKKEVYFLTGEPEWALDPEATELIAYIERIQTSQYENGPLQGVVIDVEPQSLAEFQENPSRVLETFVKGMTNAYQVAKQAGLTVILCLPNSYDTLGFEYELEQLISEATDQVAIMNYHRGQEIVRIETEAKLSLRHNKPLINIYEMQAAGQFGLHEANTYDGHGFKAVIDNFKQLERAYPKHNLSLSFHEFRSLKE